MKNSVKYYGSMVRVEVTKTTDDEITVHLEDVSAIPKEWIEKYIWSADTHEEKRALRKMYIAWEKENEIN